MDRFEERFGWTLILDDSVYTYAAENGSSRLFGARPLKRLLENIMEYGIAEYQLRNGALPIGRLEIFISVFDQDKDLFQLKVNESSFIYEVETRVNRGK